MARGFSQPTKTFRAVARNRRLSYGLPVSYSGKDIPFGYKINPDNPRELIMDEDKMKILIKAVKYLESCPRSEVITWLKSINIDMTKAGLGWILKYRKPAPEILLPIEQRIEACQKHLKSMFQNDMTSLLLKDVNKEQKIHQSLAS